MSQQQQQQQLLSHSVITALAQARIAHSMVALVRNPCRADSPSRAPPRRANPRGAKPGPMRRWRHPTCSPTLPASCARTNTSLSPPLNPAACEPRAAAQADDRCHPATQGDVAFTLEPVGRPIATVCDEDGVIFFQARHLPPSCGPGLTAATTAPALPLAPPRRAARPTPRVSRASRTTPTRRRTWSAHCTTSA